MGEVTVSDRVQMLREKLMTEKTSGFLWLKLHIIHGQELTRSMKGWCQVE